MKTITFAAEADVSNLFSSGNIREIVKKNVHVYALPGTFQSTEWHNFESCILKRFMKFCVLLSKKFMTTLNGNDIA